MRFFCACGVMRSVDNNQVAYFFSLCTFHCVQTRLAMFFIRLYTIWSHLIYLTLRFNNSILGVKIRSKNVIKMESLLLY